MQNKRLLIFISLSLLIFLLLGSIIGAFIRLLNEIRYSLEYILPYWLVGPFLLIGTGLFLVIIWQVGWPWWKTRFINSNKKHSIKDSNSPPRNRRQAASQSLDSIDKLLELIQDTVKIEGLKQERNRVEKELARGDIVVVIFGTGSSGKTSLIRALLNEIVGKVGAGMGSTRTSKVYRIKLKGLTRGLQLIDTPGILESGNEGRIREKEARLVASRADLLIVVIDSDLRASEYEILVSLTKLGKRLLLVLNKCDLRGEDEINKLLTLLRVRCKGLINPKDIISTSASPQSLPRPGTHPWQPPNEIEMLLNRLAKVLYEDGEELIADNILLQCRNLDDAGRILLDEQRNNTAQKCIDRYSWISGGIIVANPLPGIDLLGTAAVNAQMVMEIAKIYGVEITRSKAQELAISVGKTLAGVGVVNGSIKLISSTLSLNLPTLLIGQAIQGIAGAWLTKIAGSSFNTYFQQNQDWGDGGIQEVVKHHYNLNRRETSLKEFMEIALKRVVEPLQKSKFRQLPPRPKPLEVEEAWDHEHPES